MRQVLAESFSVDNANRLAISITDKEREDYSSQTNTRDWLKSNPDGYALWFASRCKENVSKRQLLAEDIVPLKKYNPDKTPLQRIVQILKRHRDMMFHGDENKPISVIITTLAALAYKGENNILEGLTNVVMTMDKFITKDENGNDKVENPLNPAENFADKWIETPIKRTNFYNWLRQIRSDLSLILASNGTLLWNNVAKSFGRTVSENANKLYTAKSKSFINSSAAKISSAGIIGAIGQSLNAANTFHGKKD